MTSSLTIPGGSITTKLDPSLNPLRPTSARVTVSLRLLHRDALAREEADEIRVS